MFGVATEQSSDSTSAACCMAQHCLPESGAAHLHHPPTVCHDLGRGIIDLIPHLHLPFLQRGQRGEHLGHHLVDVHLQHAPTHQETVPDDPTATQPTSILRSACLRRRYLLRCSPESLWIVHSCCWRLLIRHTVTMHAQHQEHVGSTTQQPAATPERRLTTQSQHLSQRCE